MDISVIATIAFTVLPTLAVVILWVAMSQRGKNGKSGPPDSSS